MDPSLLYMQHKRMEYDLGRLIQGLDAILHPSDDQERLADLNAKGILLHKSACTCQALKQSKNNEILALLSQLDESDSQRVELYQFDDFSLSTVGSVHVDIGIRDIQMDDERICLTYSDRMCFIKKAEFLIGAIAE